MNNTETQRKWYFSKATAYKERTNYKWEMNILRNFLFLKNISENFLFKKIWLSTSAKENLIKVIKENNHFLAI